jgi:hypothetical protein
VEAVEDIVRDQPHILPLVVVQVGCFQVKHQLHKVQLVM